MMPRSINRDSWDGYFMKIAHDVAGRATCLRGQVGAVAVIDNDDEVWTILARLRPVSIRHFQTKAMVLNVSNYAGVFLRNATKLPFPITVKDYPINVAFV